MPNLKNIILKELRRGNSIDKAFECLSNSQENLLKNHANPVFNTGDKNKILQKYSVLQNIGKSLYRYNMLNENDNAETAEQEKDNIENIVLKGGISYYKYRWHSENGEHTCDLCKSLDGKVFDFYDEVPQRPHPNCRCTVEIIEEDEDTNSDTESDENTEDKIIIPPPIIMPQNPPTPQPLPVNYSQKWIKPCNGPIVGHYGEQRSTHIHNGIDIAVPVGTPIKSVADGTVYYAGANDPKGYGQYVIITHKINGQIVTSEYGHLSSWNVHAGQQIKQGQIIAKSGNTGHSHGPHLHITIREGAYKGKHVNPSKYFNY